MFDIPRRLRIATRKSPLALAQAELVRMLLNQAFSDIVCQILAFSTRGDARLDLSLDQLGGKGAFTKEMDQAVIAGDADLAVHSLKVLPVGLSDALVLAGSPKRASWRDVVAGVGGAGLESLSAGTALGCGADPVDEGETRSGTLRGARQHPYPPDKGGGSWMAWNRPR